jgi:ubiquinone/menaquinone biosynthesis C-methylase UbiE
LIKYVLGTSDNELERLRIQSALFEKPTIETLNLAGIQQGMRCLDVGCGQGYTSLLISQLVGRSGKVVGMDISEDNIKTCNTKVSQNNKRLTFIVGDIYNSILDESSFDLVYSRFLFQHLPDPEKALERLLRLTADEGIVVLEELDQGLWLSYPTDPNLRKLQKAYVNLLKLSGSDPYIARKLYGIYLKTGLRPNVYGYSVCIPMNDKSFNMLGVLTAKVLKRSILKNNLMTRMEFGQMVNGLKKYALDPTGLVLYALTFRIWARKDGS